jgi:hypothetical protein
MPVPVATGDTDTTPKLDEGTTLDSSKSSSDFQRAVRVEVLVCSTGFSAQHLTNKNEYTCHCTFFFS